MRITNKIMQRNNLANINTNKTYQDTLSTQMSTQKKVARPSDDPVVAIRALRLRSNVTEVTQYYSKNIPDAESWLNVTEDALKNHAQVLTNMITQATKGANGDLTPTDRQIILEQMQALSGEIYSTANADYAGRYVFTGYRTDTSLSFVNAETKNYSITEQIHTDGLSVLTKVDMDNIMNLNEANYGDASMAGVEENNVQAVDVYRIRLAYSNCTEGGTLPSIEYTAPDGTTQTLAATKEAYSYDTPSPYVEVANDPDAIIYLPDTGEILLGENHYKTLTSVEDNSSTKADESEIRVTYEKKAWDTGDLRPEHYFACKDTETGIVYNPEYLTGTAERQDIEYDVGFNQTIRVNSTADECFQHGIGRTVDDLSSTMREVVELEAIKSKLESALATASGSDAETIQTRLDAVDKALVLSKDKCQKQFEKSITTFQNYLNDANLSITNCGTRSSKLELIKNRMQNQKTTFETLKSENEDVDITEVAIELNSAELTYEAALMATGKVMQSTLLNYI